MYAARLLLGEEAMTTNQKPSTPQCEFCKQGFPMMSNLRDAHREKKGVHFVGWCQKKYPQFSGPSTPGERLTRQGVADILDLHRQIGTPYVGCACGWKVDIQNPQVYDWQWRLHIGDLLVAREATPPQQGEGPLPCGHSKQHWHNFGESTHLPTGIKLPETWACTLCTIQRFTPEGQGEVRRLREALLRLTRLISGDWYCWCGQCLPPTGETSSDGIRNNDACAFAQQALAASPNVSGSKT